MSDENDSTNNDDTGEGLDGGGDPGRTFGQEDVDRMTKAANSKGSRQGRREALEALGVDNLDEAKALIEAERKRKEDDESAVDKAKREAEEARAHAAAVVEGARRANLESSLAMALVTVPEGSDGNPIDPARVMAAVRLEIDALMADDVNEGQDAVQAAVARTREQFPEWFSASGSSGTQQTGTPKPAGKDRKGGSGASGSSDAERQKVLDMARARGSDRIEFDLG